MTDLILKYGLILVSFFLISCLDKSNNSNQLSAFGDVKSFEKLQKTKLLAGQDKSLNHLMDYLKFSGTVELEVMKLIDSNYKKTTKIPSQINMRPVGPQEINGGRDLNQLNTPENILDLAFTPDERGAYNYNPGLDAAGLKLTNPARQNWGGIQNSM